MTFGGAAAHTKKPVKKRTRTAKIGAAAQQQQRACHHHRRPCLARKYPPRAPPHTEGDELSTRQAALAATQRAEEFLHEKTVAAADMDPSPGHGSSSSKSKDDVAFKFQHPSSESSPPAIRSVPSEEDDIIAAAKAAAEEAHKLEARHSSRGGFGGLFRSRSPAATGIGSRSSSNGNLRPHVSSSSSSHGATTPHDPAPSAADRLQKEQEQAKRAMAERQLQMMQQQQAATKSEDSADELAHSNNNNNSSSYQPVTVAPAPAPPARSFMAPKQQQQQSPQPAAAAAAPPDVLSSIPHQPQTPTTKFHAMLDDFRRQVVRSMEEVTRLRGHRAGLLEERFVTTAKERLAVQQKKQAETLQMAALNEHEDFELADQMQQTIERHEREQAEYAAILENIGRALTELDRQKQAGVDRVTQCFRDIQRQLVAFQKEQESADTRDASEALKRFALDSKQLSAEHERLQQDWKHLERDAGLVADERRELEKSITEESGVYEQLRDQARVKLTEVEEEIEELRRQLQAKQAVAAELRTEAAGHDESVLKVRVKFARQLNRVQKKEMTMNDNKEEWELEKTAYEANKERHDTEMNAHSEAMLARDKLLDALHKEIEMADTFESIVAKEIGFDAAAADGNVVPAAVEAAAETSSDDELAHLQANVVKCEASVSESKAALKAVAMALHNLEEEVQQLEAKIPQLEETKKAAAGRRDFKAAGKASKEIKEASARLAECREELESDAATRKEAAETDLAALEVELEEARRVANAKERESAVQAMARLADNIKRLVATREQVCADAAERSIPGAGALVLQAQIKALKMEGQTFGHKYGGWDELMAGIEGVQEDNGGNDNGNDDTAAAAEEAKTVSDEAAANDTPVVAESKSADEDEGSVKNRPSDQVVDDGMSSAEKMRKFRDVTERLKSMEDQLESAVAAEDFDQAAELDVVLQALLAEVEALNMTDEEMEAALAAPDDAEEDASAPEPSSGGEAQEDKAAATVNGDADPENTADNLEAASVDADAASADGGGSSDDVLPPASTESVNDGDGDEPQGAAVSDDGDDEDDEKEGPLDSQSVEAEDDEKEDPRNSKSVEAEPTDKEVENGEDANGDAASADAQTDEE